MGEGEGGMIWENSIETCILSSVKQIASPGWIHETTWAVHLLRAGALGWPRGMGCGGRWEGGSGWGTHVNPWHIHVNVWQKPLQYCKVINLQLIKKKNKKKTGLYDDLLLLGSLFHFFYFIFSAPISLSLYSPVSLSLLYIWCSFSSLYQV